ncbi:hypothetical protein ACHAWF_015019 [Thalassiosira exigua]
MAAPRSRMFLSASVLAATATAMAASRATGGTAFLPPHRPWPGAGGGFPRGGTFGSAPAAARRSRASPAGMSPSDVSAEATGPSVDADGGGSRPVPLFDASEFLEDGTDGGVPSNVPFEDVASEYDELSPSGPVDGADADASQYERNVLTDEEDRMLTDREDRLFQYVNNTQKIEGCILVGVEDLSKARKARKSRRRNEDVDVELTWTLEESMVEMRELIKTSGLRLEGEITQRLQEVNPRTYIGTGKVKEAQSLMDEVNAALESRDEPHCCTVVFDAELSPGQQKALENAFNREVLANDFLGADQEDVVKVVDRTALILDIFSQHAKTREGKLQVDLALHEYRKPRLTRMWTHLERQSGSGGVGLRGPGETQLEVDKRLLRDRILVLKGKIDDVQKQRDLHRRGRKRGGLPVLALGKYHLAFFLWDSLKAML